MDYRGKFIVFEGLTCSGKSLQVKALARHFSDNNLPVVLNYEPTNRLFGKLIRNVIEGKAISQNLKHEIEGCFTILVHQSNFDAELLKLVKEIYHKLLDGQVISEFERQVLFIADRWNDLVQNIIPALDQEVNVINDRYDLSTFAYGIAHYTNYEKLARLQKEWLAGVYRIPDITIFIDISLEEAIKRLKKSGKMIDRYEEDLESAKRIKAAYESLFTLRKGFLGDLVIIDGHQSIEKVTDDIKARL